MVYMQLKLLPLFVVGLGCFGFDVVVVCLFFVYFYCLKPLTGVGEEDTGVQVENPEDELKKMHICAFLNCFFSLSLHGLLDFPWTRHT